MSYTLAMGTTTVRLDAADERILDRLAAVHGGRSNAIRYALRAFATEEDRQENLKDLLDDWEREAGPVDEAEVQDMIKRYNL